MADFIEYVQSTSPGAASFAMEGGRATLLLDVIGPADNLEEAITELLGACKAKGDGRLERTLPKAHPLFPWLFCERINNIQGMGPDADDTPAEPELEAPSLSSYQGYSRYRLTCEFTPRPYAVLPDSEVEVSSSSYYTDAGGSTSSTVAQEWVRFLDVQADAKPELATAQQGEMVFLTNAGTTPPHNVSFPGFPRIYLPNGQVRMRWYQVPERYVSSRNSNLKKYIGRVNQTGFDQWEAGELLYLGYTQRRYTPPIPDRVANNNDNTIFTAEKLVDLELTFEETVRTIGSAWTPSNASWVAGGHNLQPFLRDQKFYFAGRKSSTASERLPTFLSFQIGLLFTDPDVA